MGNGRSYTSSLSRDFKFWMILLTYSFIGTFYLFITKYNEHVCPYKWNGGSPTSLLEGSCWCGKDKYCMCTPSLAIDAIIEVTNSDEISVLLVHRGVPPEGYAIPGGFVDIGESVEEATIREVHEETNISLELKDIEQFKIYSDPKRDKRRHTVSAVFRCRANDISSLKSGDDARSLKVKPLRDVLKLKNLAFDHKHIFEEYTKKFHPHLLD